MKADTLNHIQDVKEVNTIQYSIYHKFCFNNKTDHELLVYQAGMKGEEIQKCPPNKTLPFIWTNVASVMKVQIEFADSSPSEPFDIDKIGTIVLQLMSADKKTLGKIIAIERTIEKGSFTIDIQEESLEKPHYLIQNDSKYISISYRDKHSRRKAQLLNLGEKAPLGWRQSDGQQIIAMQLHWGRISEKSSLLSPKEYEYSFEIIKNYAPIKIKLTETESKIIFVSVQSNGFSKIMKICDIEKDAKDNLNETISTYYISQLGVSFIAKVGQSRREIFYLYCGGISANIKEKTQSKQGELSIMNIQVDNQYNYEATYPVALRAEKESLEKPLLQIKFRYYISSEPNLNFVNIDYLYVSLLPLAIRLQEDTLIAFTDTIFNTLKSNQEKNELEDSKSQITFNIYKLSTLKICKMVFF